MERGHIKLSSSTVDHSTFDQLHEQHPVSHQKYAGVWQLDGTPSTIGETGLHKTFMLKGVHLMYKTTGCVIYFIFNFARNDI